MDDEYQYLFDELNHIKRRIDYIEAIDMNYDEIERYQKELKHLRERLDEVQNYYEVEEFLLTGPGKKVDKL
jgi:prefoldin subunit 5